MRAPFQSQLHTVILVTCLASGGFIPQALPADTTGAGSDENRTVALYERLAPATVSLSVTYPSGGLGAGTTHVGVGAGFIVDEQGTILTNAHVVEGASVITASLFNGARVNIALLAIDPTTDVAILRLPPGHAPVPSVMLGDSDAVRVGQQTLVVGSPFGLGFTLTNGIISGFQPDPAGGATGSHRFIQTTAPINPGNSGGPLVDSRGRVIGMSKAVVLGAQNIGFAIPINVAKRVLIEFNEKGKIVRPWLGVSGKFVTEDLRRLLALPLTSGLLVEHVDEASPASEAGLRSGSLNVTVDDISWNLGGDILTNLQGRSLRTPKDFAEALQTVHAGDEVQIEVFRDHEYMQLSVMLHERPTKSGVNHSSPPQNVVGMMPDCHARPSPCAVTPF
ncbi:MAG TPA: trypsin-like peptidase domain-containing protein [Nitrospiraceae bacterium]|nr:trypsin-like peptidase domain-containing protein [Nitrospiraceae bacterium]